MVTVREIIVVYRHPGADPSGNYRLNWPIAAQALAKTGGERRREPRCEAPDETVERLYHPLYSATNGDLRYSLGITAGTATW